MADGRSGAKSVSTGATRRTTHIQSKSDISNENNEQAIAALAALVNAQPAKPLPKRPSDSNNAAIIQDNKDNVITTIRGKDLSEAKEQSIEENKRNRSQSTINGPSTVMSTPQASESAVSPLGAVVNTDGPKYSTLQQRFSAAASLPSSAPRPPAVNNPSARLPGIPARRPPGTIPTPTSPTPSPKVPSKPPPSSAPPDISPPAARHQPGKLEHNRLPSVDMTAIRELENVISKGFARKQSEASVNAVTSIPSSSSGTPTRQLSLSIKTASEEAHQISSPGGSPGGRKNLFLKKPASSPRTLDIHGNYLPPAKSVVMEIFSSGLACAKRVKLLNDQFVEPVLNSQFAARLSNLSDKHRLEFSVEEAVFPLANLHSVFNGFFNEKHELDVLRDDDVLTALEKTMVVVSQFGTPQVVNNLKHVVESFNKLQYLFDIALPPKSKRKDNSLDEEDLQQPIIYLTFLECHLNLLTEILKVEFTRYTKYIVVFEEIAKGIAEASKLDGWKAIFRRTVLDLNKSITSSIDKNLLPDILDPRSKLALTGIFQRNNTVAFMSKLKYFSFYLFSNLLVWTSVPNGKFKGSLLLSHRMIVGRSSSKVSVTMPSLTDKKELNNNIDFFFDALFMRDIFDYYLSKMIAELPKEVTQDVDRVISARSKKIPIDGFFNSTPRKSESHENVSRPFNVQKREVINFNLEWQGEIDEQIKLLQKVGSGGFGTVFKAVHIASGMEMAAKLVAFKDTKQEQSIRKEIELLKILKHDNIVSYYGCAGPDKKGLLWILMDYCSAGSLSAINNHSRKAGKGVAFSELQIGHILSKVLLALVYLHQRQIIHRDIKCGNVLLTSRGEVRLADFGVSKQISIAEETVNKGIVGSAHWLPPEALGSPDGGAETKVQVGEKGDVWSLGITAIELSEGMPPNFELPPVQAMLKTLSDPPPKLNEIKWSEPFQRFVARCLVKDPSDRPTAAQLLQDPFIIGHIVRPYPSVLAPVLSSLVIADSVAVDTDKKGPQASPSHKNAAKGERRDLASPPSPSAEKAHVAADETFLATHTIIIDDEEDDDIGSDDDVKATTVPTGKMKSIHHDNADDGYGSDLNSGDEFELNTQASIAD